MGDVEVILAIDPGTFETGYVVVKDDLSKVIEKGKIDNFELLKKIRNHDLVYDSVAIEKIKSYGMSVGDSVFDTCIWIGRFYEAINTETPDVRIKFITRIQEKTMICHSSKANDTTIKHALIDRFAPYTENYGKGTKKNPGYFYGFKQDIWSAMAIAVTYHDLRKEGNI